MEKYATQWKVNIYCYSYYYNQLYERNLSELQTNLKKNGWYLQKSQKNRTSFTDIPFIFCILIFGKKIPKFVINVTSIRKIILYLKTPSLFKSQEGNRLLLIFSHFFRLFRHEWFTASWQRFKAKKGLAQSPPGLKINPRAPQRVEISFEGSFFSNMPEYFCDKQPI